MESSNRVHFGTNINSSGPLYRDCPLLRDSNCIVLIGFSFVHCREIFNTVSLIRSVR